MQRYEDVAESEDAPDALTGAVRGRLSYLRARQSPGVTTSPPQSNTQRMQHEISDDLKLRRHGRLSQPAVQGTGHSPEAAVPPMNRWLPLPEGLYPGLGKGTRFAQIMYVSPGTHSLAEWATGWRSVVGRRLAGVDPGVRTLYTLYDPERCAYVRLGYGWSNFMDRSVYRIIRKLQGSLEALAQVLAEHVSAGTDATETRARIDREQRELASRRAQARVESDRMDEIVFCVLRTYPVLILPAYGSKTGSRQSRRISRSVTRRQAYHSFYGMRERLKRHHALLGWIVDLGTEAYSTQCCPGCGEQNPTVGAGKFHPCRRKPSPDHPACPHYDRDCGSARSITVRHLRKYLPEIGSSISVPHVSPSAVMAGSSLAER